MGQTLIVGRKTFETLPILPGRSILLLSRSISTSTANKHGLRANVITKPTGLEDAIVAGGREVYSVYLPYITEFYVSYIHGDHTGDVSMMEFESQFQYSSIIQEVDDVTIMKFSKNRPL